MPLRESYTITQEASGWSAKARGTTAAQTPLPAQVMRAEFSSATSGPATLQRGLPEGSAAMVTGEGPESASSSSIRSEMRSENFSGDCSRAKREPALILILLCSQQGVHRSSCIQLTSPSNCDTGELSRALSRTSTSDGLNSSDVTL